MISPPLKRGYYPCPRDPPQAAQAFPAGEMRASSLVAKGGGNRAGCSPLWKREAGGDFWILETRPYSWKRRIEFLSSSTENLGSK